MLILYSAGALMSTVEDIYEYYRALNSYKLVSKESLEKTRTNYSLINGEETSYGYGVQVKNIHGYDAIYHLGGANGFFTLQIYFPEKDINFILFTNCANNFGKAKEYFKIATQTIEDL